jgi:hypothetical protein
MPASSQQPSAAQVCFTLCDLSTIAEPGSLPNGSQFAINMQICILI